MGHQAGCRVQLQEYKNQLQGFCRDLEGTRSWIEQAVELYRFLEQVSSEETQLILFSVCQKDKKKVVLSTLCCGLVIRLSLLAGKTLLALTKCPISSREIEGWWGAKSSYTLKIREESQGCLLSRGKAKVPLPWHRVLSPWPRGKG